MATVTGTALPATSIYDDKMRLAAMSSRYSDEPDDSNISTGRRVWLERRRKALIALFVILAVLFLAVAAAMVFRVNKKTSPGVLDEVRKSLDGSFPIISQTTSHVPIPDDGVEAATGPLQSATRTSMLPPEKVTMVRKRVIAMAIVAGILVIAAVVLTLFVLFVTDNISEELVEDSFACPVEEKASIVLSKEWFVEQIESRNLNYNLLAVGIFAVVCVLIYLYILICYLPGRVLSVNQMMNTRRVPVYIYNRSHEKFESDLLVYPGLTLKRLQKSNPGLDWDNVCVLQSGSMLEPNDQLYFGPVLIMHREVVNAILAHS